MKIGYVDIQNFRKLKTVRIAFSDSTTIFVGANNSGKTSAMLALGHFLIDPRRFNTNDFTLSNWSEIENIASAWETDVKGELKSKLSLETWETYLPTLDVWLEVGKSEVHYVSKILPSLDWKAGLLGVRLRYEPKKLENLYEDYLKARTAAKDAKKGWKPKKTDDTGPKLWPKDLRSFLDKKLNTYFDVRLYLLNPAQFASEGKAFKPQTLANASEPVEGNPLDGLIRIDEIAAQRNLGNTSPDSTDDEAGEKARDNKKLSNQLRTYYSRHLDPAETPEAEDLVALDAIEESQKVFDERLAVNFKAAIEELQTLNYPGITNPELKIATRIRPTEGLNHSGAVQFEVLPVDGKTVLMPLRLPEEYNGLGYQNLISMVFRLMSFRDAWMRVGKAAKGTTEKGVPALIPPIHLVLVEEPEAHLHAQVQQVFVRKAYDVLRNNVNLKDAANLVTQLLVSTHSSHVAHEAPFSWLRYFKRLPANSQCNVPTSIVINLSEVFGPNDETNRFVARYLKSNHCDLFFADAAIFIEGSAERILLPHFLKKQFPELNRCFITMMEIGGSHAHRLKPLIEKLCLTTLIVTDLDSVEEAGHHESTPPIPGKKQLTANATLKSWHPEKKTLDELISVKAEDKVKIYPESHFFVRVAYQLPVDINFQNISGKIYASTFEDAVVIENLDAFANAEGEDMIADFKAAIQGSADLDTLRTKLFQVVRKGDKARFALDLLMSQNGKQADDSIEKLRMPKYVEEGMSWLHKELVQQKKEILASSGDIASKENKQ